MQIYISFRSRPDLVLDADHALIFKPISFCRPCISFCSVSDKVAHLCFCLVRINKALAHRFYVMTPKISSPECLCNGQPQISFFFFKCNFLTHNGLHGNCVMSRRIIPPVFYVCNVFLRGGVTVCNHFVPNSSCFSPVSGEPKISLKLFRPKFCHGRSWAMSVPQCLAFQSLTRLTEVFDLMFTGMPGP